MASRGHLKLLNGVASIPVRIVADPDDEIKLQDEKDEGGVPPIALIRDRNTNNRGSELQKIATRYQTAAKVSSNSRLVHGMLTIRSTTQSVKYRRTICKSATSVV